MTKQQEIDLNSEIRGITPAKLWYYGGSLVAVLFTVFMMYSAIVKRLDIKDEKDKDIIRRIEKLEQKAGI